MTLSILKKIIVIVFASCLVLVIQNNVHGQENSKKGLYSDHGDIISLMPKYKSWRKRQIRFYGLASFYNSTSYSILSADGVKDMAVGESATVVGGDLIAIKSRLSVLFVKAPGHVLTITPDDFTLTPGQGSSTRGHWTEVKNENLTKFEPSSVQLKFNHLWTPFAYLARLAEHSLILIQSNIVSHWGLTIIVFSFLLKILLIPLSMLVVSFQRSVSKHQALLEPIMDDIRKNLSGQKAHEKQMAAYKELGITPYYSLKPLVGTLVQVPILIAVFNALGEMSQFNDQSFLWVKNLADVDMIAVLPFSLPLFGPNINLLPAIMTVITIFSTIIFNNRHSSTRELSKQKRNLYFMAFVFFVLFYSFPANMVLFWTLANIFQTIQQQILRL